MMQTVKANGCGNTITVQPSDTVCLHKKKQDNEKEKQMKKYNKIKKRKINAKEKSSNKFKNCLRNKIRSKAKENIKFNVCSCNVANPMEILQMPTLCFVYSATLR